MNLDNTKIFSSCTGFWNLGRTGMEYVLDHINSDCIVRNVQSVSSLLKVKTSHYIYNRGTLEQFLIFYGNKCKRLKLLRRKGKISQFSEDFQKDPSEGKELRFLDADITPKYAGETPRYVANSSVALIMEVKEGIYVYNWEEDIPIRRLYDERVDLSTYNHQPTGMFKKRILKLGRKARSVELMPVPKLKSDNKNWTRCKTPLPGLRRVGSSLTNIYHDKVVWIGGYNLSGIASSDVYQGQLSTDEEDVSWKQLPSLREPRYFHVVFKINNMVCVCGGFYTMLAHTVSSFRSLSSCEVYCSDSKRWSIRHHIPEPLDSLFAVSNRNEEFALIMGRRPAYGARKSKSTFVAMSYTVDEGFVVVGKLKLADTLTFPKAVAI